MKTSWRRSFVWAFCGALALSAPASPQSGLMFRTENPRGGETPVFTRSSYDSVPTALQVGNTYRMWWCGGVAGDHVLHAQADNLGGPWHSATSTQPNSYDDVFAPVRPDPDDFDTLHTCDPSVIKVGAWYYLYYGADTRHGRIGQNTNFKTCACDGIAFCRQDQCDGTTRIGVARSPDGLQWERLNGGLPIIQPAWARPGAKTERPKPSPYAAGQPSVTYVDGYFYVIYTDTTGAASHPVDGSGQYVLRSPDPAFRDGPGGPVEELTCLHQGSDGQCDQTGFVRMTPDNHTRYSLFYAASVDWQYVDALDAFLLAINFDEGETQIRLLSRASLLGNSPLGIVTIPGTFRDGSAIVSTPDKHGIPAPGVNGLRVDLLRAVGTDDPNTWDLAHNGADLRW